MGDGLPPFRRRRAGGERVRGPASMASPGAGEAKLRSGRRLNRQRQEAHRVARLDAQQHRLMSVRLGGVEGVGDIGGAR